MLPQQPARHAGLIERSKPKEGTAMEAQMTVNATRNGLDMDLLQGIVGELREHPETATVTVRTRHRWDEGFAVEGYTEGFEQAGEASARTFTFPHGLAVGSWRPRQRSGARRGDPWRAWRLCRHDLHHQAATRGVDIEELEVIIEAAVDLRGIFDLAAVRAGLAGALVTMQVRSSADDAALEELRQLVTRTSAVYDSLANPVPIQLSLQRLS
jgi:hypothetical protein